MRSDVHLQQFLSVVSEWSSIGTSGVRVGNAFPIYSLTKQAVVASPVEEFPNPGAIFLVNRGKVIWTYSTGRGGEILPPPAYADIVQQSPIRVPGRRRHEVRLA